MSLALHTDIPDNPRPTSRSPRFFRDSRWRHFATLSVLLCLTDPAWAANSGGSVDTDCDPSGSSYIGTCGMDSTPATGGDVHIDTHPGPTVINVIGGMNDGGGDATGNRVRVGGYETYHDTWFTGGSTCSGDAVNNTVIIGDRAIVKTGAAGGESCSGGSRGNTVTIQDQSGIDGGTIIGGSGYDISTGNTIIIRDQATVTGGSLIMGGEALGSATNNTVIIRDQAVVRDGAIYGGQSVAGSATGNTIIIGDRARVEDGVLVGGLSVAANASGNTIVISDHARVENSTVIGGLTPNGDTTHNRIILQGSPILTDTILSGGTGNAITGNTLEIRGTGLSAEGVSDFDLYRYLLPASATTGTPMLALTGFACMCEATVMVDVAPGTTPFQPGTQFTLMHSNGLTTDRYSDSPTYIIGRQGLALSYRWGLTATATDVVATVDSVSASEESKAPLEGRIASLALINQSGDMIAGVALDRAQTAANINQWTGFGALGGGSSRYDSGSHVDLDGLSFVLGTARRFNTGYGSLTAGAFLELGYGSYGTDNQFAGGTVHGSGNSRYYGVGLMARHYFADPAPADRRGHLGPYAQASLRVGRIDTDWHTTDPSWMQDTDISYDSNVPYYGAHLGLGYVLGTNARTTTDLYVNYFWSHQDGDEVSIAGDPFHFDATDSHRVRIGTRVSYLFSDQTRAYAGAAWEHEFSSNARATTYGFETPSPSLQGDTGVFELGLEITPRQARALTVNLGVQAYTGKREGWGGNASLKYAF